MDDMKEALDKAAISSDQAVRNMAIRYREMRNEFEQYEAFFNIYKLGVKPNGTATVVRAPAVVRERTLAPRTSTPRSDRVDTFSTAMQAILIATGHPMKLNEVYTTYQEQHPEDQTTIETFRQRLVKRRGVITLIPRQGYWWADAPLPSETSAPDA
jgi:hypothetical protein